ncbi:MAG: hypothetical protein ACD_54C00108G0004 [uncultured bacterium]|nr:MAG: hypothetical protein ACD_54C00108G0004 [uncultured bacterium]
MLLITQKDYQEACQIGMRQVYARLKPLTSKTIAGVKHYPLPDVLAGLPPKYASTALVLLKRAVEDGARFCGDDGDLPATEALERFLNAHVHGAAHRIAQCRKSYFHGLGLAVRSSGWMCDAERLRVLILRDGGCLSFIMTGDPSTLPRDWAAFSRVFALLHASAPLTSEYVTGLAA